jgi:hypothetical protein
VLHNLYGNTIDSNTTENMDKTDIAHASNQYVEKLNIVLKTLRKQQI